MTNVIKFQAPFERLKQYNSPFIGLHKAIIMQAIIDASNISTQPAAKKLELEAKKWLFGDSKEFERTCYDVNYEPDFVRNIAKKIINLHLSKEQQQQLKIRTQLEKLLN